MMLRLRTLSNRLIGHFLNFTRPGQWIMAHRMLRLYRNAQSDYVRTTLRSYCRYLLRERFLPIRSTLFQRVCQELAFGQPRARKGGAHGAHGD